MSRSYFEVMELSFFCFLTSVFIKYVFLKKTMVLCCFGSCMKIIDLDDDRV